MSERARPTTSTLQEQLPWIRRIDTLDEDNPMDVRIRTTVGLVVMDEHTRRLRNYGYEVNRIGWDDPYGAKFYCTKS